MEDKYRIAFVVGDMDHHYKEGIYYEVIDGVAVCHEENIKAWEESQDDGYLIYP